MHDEPRDPIASRPGRRSIHPFYLWVLIAAVTLMIFGSPTLVRLCEWAGVAGLSVFVVFHYGVLIALTLGTVVLAPIAVIRRRFQGPEASRSYGAAAVLAVATGIGFAVLEVLYTALRLSLHRRPGFTYYGPFYLEMIVAPVAEYSVIAITTAWVILAMTGVGRRASNGFERLCLGLGVLWILAYLGRCVLEITPWLL